MSCMVVYDVYCLLVCVVLIVVRRMSFAVVRWLSVVDGCRLLIVVCK